MQKAEDSHLPTISGKPPLLNVFSQLDPSDLEGGGICGFSRPESRFLMLCFALPEPRSLG